MRARELRRRKTQADDEAGDHLVKKADAAFVEMADLTPETWHGIWAMALAIRAEPGLLTDTGGEESRACGRMALKIAQAVNCPWQIAGQPSRSSRPMEGA